MQHAGFFARQWHILLAALAVIVFNTLQYVIKAEVRAGKTSIADKLCTRVRQHGRPKARETPILRRQGFRPLCPPLCTPASHAARYDGQATKRGEGGVGHVVWEHRAERRTFMVLWHMVWTNSSSSNF